MGESSLQICGPNHHDPNSVLDLTLKPDENPWALSNQVGKISEGRDPHSLTRSLSLPEADSRISPFGPQSSPHFLQHTACHWVHPRTFASPVCVAAVVHSTDAAAVCHQGRTTVSTTHTCTVQAQRDRRGHPPSSFLPPARVRQAFHSANEVTNSPVFSQRHLPKVPGITPGGRGESSEELCAPVPGKRAALWRSFTQPGGGGYLRPPAAPGAASSARCAPSGRAAGQSAGTNLSGPPGNALCRSPGSAAPTCPPAP